MRFFVAAGLRTGAVLVLMGVLASVGGSFSPARSTPRLQSYIPIVVTPGGGGSGQRRPTDCKLDLNHSYEFDVSWAPGQPTPLSVEFSATLVGFPGTVSDYITWQNPTAAHWHQGCVTLLKAPANGGYIELSACVTYHQNNGQGKQCSGSNERAHIFYLPSAPPDSLLPRDCPQASSGGRAADQADQNRDPGYIPIVTNPPPTSAGLLSATEFRIRYDTVCPPMQTATVPVGQPEEFTIGWSDDPFGERHDPFPPQQVVIHIAKFHNCDLVEEDVPSSEAVVVEQPWYHDPQWHHKGTVRFLQKTDLTDFYVVYAKINGNRNFNLTDHAVRVTVE